MKRSILGITLVSLGATLGTTGCSDFLSGNDFINNPNNPSAATLQQSFMAVQAAFFGAQESTLPLTTCMWMQQCTGIGGRFVGQYGRYTVTDASWSGDFSAVYTGGGLVDVRRVENGARAANDKTWLGIAQVYEAFLIGNAADLWGDIPYREAAGNLATPALDPQMQVYGDVQALLDSAIVNLGAAVGTGPAVSDLVYGGNRTTWIQAANTLKARFYMHTAESVGATAYTAAITAATAGISDTANDFRTLHGSGTGEGNIWVQFSATTFGQDVVAGKRLVDIMVARTDPRLVQFFDKNTTAKWEASHKYTIGVLILDPNGNAQEVSALVGDSVSGPTEPAWPTTVGATKDDSSASGVVRWRNYGLPYGGQDVNVPQRAATVSKLGGTRHDALFRQPLVTYAENQLILAEAKHATANDPGALVNLNNARAIVPLSALVGITGTALLDSIMNEKYVALFQNIETYNDYRRTCRPALAPFPTSEFANKVPGRLFYGLAEENANPNIPSSSVQLSTNGFRNPNDPAACP